MYMCMYISIHVYMYVLYVLYIYISITQTLFDDRIGSLGRVVPRAVPCPW